MNIMQKLKTGIMGVFEQLLILIIVAAIVTAVLLPIIHLPTLTLAFGPHNVVINHDPNNYEIDTDAIWKVTHKNYEIIKVDPKERKGYRSRRK